MIRSFYILFGVLCVSLSLVAQPSHHPQRTAEDIARKQTEMLVRELGIGDSVIRHTLFQMYLKYAHLRDKSNTRNEAIQRMIQIQEELKTILTPEQFTAFMNRQVNYNPRLPQHPCNWIAPHPKDTPPPPPHDNGEAPNMPPPPPEHQP